MAVMSGPLVSYRDVRMDGVGGPVLRGATGDIPAAGITAVIGPSGSGKSTLLRLANGLERVDSGTVIALGEDVATQDPLALRRRLGMVFQRPTLFPGTVFENLRVADRAIDEAAGRALLTRAALDPDLLERDYGLSGGEAQRACIARALAARPQALLMDEPTSSLDPHARDEIEALARDLAAEGLPVVWVTHALDQMNRIADHVLVVIAGRIVFAGPPDALSIAGADVLAFTEMEFDAAR